MNIYSSLFTLSCYIYMYVGMALFFLGWVKSPISIVALIFMGIVLWWQRGKLYADSSKKLYIHPAMLVVIAGFCITLCIVCGQGAFFPQAGDWDKHNRVLNDLVFCSWPVCYHNDHESSMLTYYIGQYLFPALCGKITSNFRVAEITLLFYNGAGIFCVILLLFRVVKADTIKKQLVSLLVFTVFGTCLFLGKKLYQVMGATDISDSSHWISDSILLQYRTLFVSLRWVFPQAIVPWISTLLFIENYKDVSSYCLIGAPLLLCATFPFLGLVLLMVGAVLGKAFIEKKFWALVKEIFSWQNILVAVISLIPLLYLLGNVLQKKTPETGFSCVNYATKPVLYFCFVSSFLVYSIVIYRKYKRDLLFYLVNLCLLVLPFFRMGVYNDLVMGVSIPAVFLLMIFVLKALFQYFEHRTQKPECLIALVILLVIGAIYPVEELAEALEGPVSRHGSEHGSMSDWVHRDGTIDAAEAYNYFTYDYETSLFYRFCSKQIPNENF